MNRFKVVKRGAKYFVNTELFGDRMIYQCNSNAPYIKIMSEKFILDQDLKDQLRELIQA